MSKQFWGVIIAIVIIFFGIFALSGNKDDKSNSSGSNKKELTQHITGNKDSGVALVEYGDYQCPYCQGYDPVIKAVQQKFEGKMSFQFRNYPLQSLHPNAFAAARAAEAAGLQNKYWEMHDALYLKVNWDAWKEASNPNPYFEKFAKTLGLNLAQFKSDFASTKVNDLINADLGEGNKLGITGTPTFYLNGKKIEVDNQNTLEKVIQSAVDKQAAKKPSTNQ